VQEGRGWAFGVVQAAAGYARICRKSSAKRASQVELRAVWGCLGFIETGNGGMQMLLALLGAVSSGLSPTCHASSAFSASFPFSTAAVTVAISLGMQLQSQSPSERKRVLHFVCCLC